MPSSNGDTTAFTLRLFAGLIVFWLMAEVITQSLTSVVEQTNLVKKSVFPLEVIPAVVVGTALFHSLISTLVLIAALLVLGAGVHPTIILFPLVILPLALLLTGFAWLLALVCTSANPHAHCRPAHDRCFSCRRCSIPSSACRRACRRP